MWLLLQLTYRVPRWPVHPIGLTIGYTHPTAVMAFSVLLTWAVKSLIMSIGGRPLYEKAKPLFLGLIVGYLAGVGVALVVDLVCFGPGQGHPIYSL